MSDRIVRSGILKSEKVNSLSWEAEVFYRRLFSVVDDFGRYEANPSILRADLYPLKLESVRESNIERLLAAVEQAGLVRLYAVSGKRFLEVQNFGQRLRTMKSRYPSPTSADIGGHPLSIDSGCQQSADIRRHPPTSAARNETETKRSEGETKESVFARDPSQASRPKTEDDAVKLCRGQLVDAPEDFIRQLFAHLESVNWMAGDGVNEIGNFGQYVRKAWLKQKDERARRDSGSRNLNKHREPEVKRQANGKVSTGIDYGDVDQ